MVANVRAKGDVGVQDAQYFKVLFKGGGASRRRRYNMPQTIWPVFFFFLRDFIHKKLEH